MRLPRIIGHDVHLLLPHHVAAEVLREFDRLLVRHAQVARLVVRPEELLAIVNVIHIAPAAAIHRLQESVLAHVGKHTVPIQRILQVAHRPVRGSFGKLLVGQDHGGGHGHAQLGGQRVVEKLVVGRPPERIVDDHRSVDRGVLQIGAIEGNVVRNAIHDHRVAGRLVQSHRADLDKLRLNPVDVPRIDVLNQCAWKAVLHAEEDADLFHCALTSVDFSSKQGRTHRVRGQNSARHQCTAGSCRTILTRGARLVILPFRGG